MELQDRLKFILENNKIKPGISEYEFAKSVGTYSAKFAEIRSGKVKTLSVDIALEISKQYGFGFKWILTGEGEIFTDEKHQEGDCVNIPILGDVEASCGHGVVVYSENKTAEYPIGAKLLEDLGASFGNSEVIFAKGDSMLPTIESGDSILVDRSKKEIYDGTIYCVRIDGQLYAKRLQKIPPNKIKVISDNKEKYDPFYIDCSKEIDFDFEIIGEVRWWGRVAK